MRPLSRTICTTLIALATALPAACGRPEARAVDSAAVGGALDTAVSVAQAPVSVPSLGDTALTVDSAAALPAAVPAPRAEPSGSASAPGGPMPDTPNPSPKPAPAEQERPAPAQPTPAPASVPAAPVESASATAVTPRAPDAAARARVPFGVGERYTYDVRFGSLDVGDGVMEVVGEESIRGRSAYHVLFRVSGGTAFFRVRDRYESWMDVRTLQSLRHIQDIDEASYERRSVFEFFPERGTFQENQKPERPTVESPLDDGSFFFFVRTIPLEVGQSYTFERYFKPDRNPVRINVLRRERVRVPAGTFDAIVIQPIIRTKGVFGEGGRAEIWIADDSTRAMLQMKSRLKFGSLNLFLKERRPATR